MDPPPQRQPGLPPVVYRTIIRASRGSKRSFFTANLVGGCVFFACRSCEYTKVPRAEQLKTMPVTVNGLTFWKGGLILQKKEGRQGYLGTADSVSMTFFDQKNGERLETITQTRSGDPALCPVVCLAYVVEVIMQIPGWKGSWPIHTFRENGKTSDIERSEVIDALQSGVRMVGEKKLGLKAEDIKSHCVRTSFALWMAMLRQPDYLIMLLGRWKSDKFMDYIRHQVLQFTEGVARKMVGINDFASIRLRPEVDETRQSGNGHRNSIAGATRTRALAAQGLTTVPALRTRR